MEILLIHYEDSNVQRHFCFILQSVLSSLGACTVLELQTLTPFVTQPAAQFTPPVLQLCLHKCLRDLAAKPIEELMELKNQNKTKKTFGMLSLNIGDMDPSQGDSTDRKNMLWFE